MCFTTDFFFFCTWFEKMEAVTGEALAGVALIGKPLDTCKFYGNFNFLMEMYEVVCLYGVFISM